MEKEIKNKMHLIEEGIDTSRILLKNKQQRVEDLYYFTLGYIKMKDMVDCEVLSKKTKVEQAEDVFVRSNSSKAYQMFMQNFFMVDAKTIMTKFDEVIYQLKIKKEELEMQIEEITNQLYRLYVDYDDLELVLKKEYARNIS